jgi:ADP-ribosyl-[dinitrogen reductase] hydrolase
MITDYNTMKDEARFPNIHNIDKLLEYLSYFDNRENNFFELINKPPQIPFYSYSDMVMKFYKSLYNENMIKMFDWSKWGSEAKKYINDPLKLEKADLPTIQKLFTTIIRADRFSEGLLGDMIDDGVILNLLVRLEQIREEIVDRFYGSLIGLAVGDAMGAPLEFKSPGSFEPVNDMIGDGPHHLKPGEWTDDTSMALCLAESLIETGKFDPVDQLSRYLRWYRDGYLSVNDKCFDIGNTTREALMIFEETGEHYPGPENEYSAGNGSLMRLSPVPLFYMSNPKDAIEMSGKSSRTTHNHPLAVDACRYMGGLIQGALIGTSKEELLSERYSPVQGYWNKNTMAPEIEKVACGSFKRKEPPEIRGRGYVVKSLEAALWAFYKSNSFEEGCLLAINLGEDADTTGAIYGQLAGAYYGFSNIPYKWGKKLAKTDMIEIIIEKLLKSSNQVRSL